MEKKIIKLGFYDNGTGQHQSNTVYSSKGMIPALTTITGGGTEQIKVLKRLDSMRTENIIHYRQTDRQTDRQTERHNCSWQNREHGISE